MNDWDKIFNLTSSMKGFGLPAPKPFELAHDYYIRCLQPLGNYTHALAGIHAIAYRHVQNLSQPIRNEGEPSPESKEGSQIPKENRANGEKKY